MDTKSGNYLVNIYLDRRKIGSTSFYYAAGTRMRFSEPSKVELSQVLLLLVIKLNIHVVNIYFLKLD